MLVNILGTDGCGKTTQLVKLKKWLEEDLNLKFSSLVKRDIFDTNRFPECDFFGCSYEKLAHQLLPMMRAESRSLWLIYMNSVLIKHYLTQENEIGFLDGYWHKHYATEAALGVDKDWLLQVCSFFPEPDLTILLDVDPRITVNRGHLHKPYESGCDFQCSDESFISHQDKVRENLLELAGNRDYVIIDADKSIELLFKDIHEVLFPAIKKYTALKP